MHTLYTTLHCTAPQPHSQHRPTPLHTCTTCTIPVHPHLSVVSARACPLCFRQVWTLAGGLLLRTILLPAALTCIALDPAEWSVYAGAATGYIYSVPLSGAPQGSASDEGAFELAGHQRPVSALAAAADCRRLASASEDGTIKARHGATVSPLRWHGGTTAVARAHRRFLSPTLPCPALCCAALALPCAVLRLSLSPSLSLSHSLSPTTRAHHAHNTRPAAGVGPEQPSGAADDAQPEERARDGPAAGAQGANTGLT